MGSRCVRLAQPSPDSAMNVAQATSPAITEVASYEVAVS